MDKPFLGKKALVVGGTGGIGRSVAVGLAEKGAELTVHGGSSKERLESTLKAVRDSGAKADGFLLSVGKPEAAQLAAEEILAHSPQIDILVCAWGPFKQGNIEELNGDFWQDMITNNLILPGILVSRVLRGMMERNWGRILLFGGTNTDTIRGFTTTAAYSTAKTALGVLAKSVAKSCGSRGVTCNVLCPGLTDTEYVSEAQRRYNLEKSPGGKPLNPEQIALAALAVLGNPCINGAVIASDQGLVL
jgi:NAD(P)-dependent dehydrogenase (short-subunit alcohol dehydrogenase family)